MFTFTGPWEVKRLSIEDFLVGMSGLGTPQEIQMVGSFARADDDTVRTAHRDVDLPLHRDGVYTKAIADMQQGRYVEKPNVDIIGMYCVRTNGNEPCYTTVSEDGQNIVAALHPGSSGDAHVQPPLAHGPSPHASARLGDVSPRTVR